MKKVRKTQGKFKWVNLNSIFDTYIGLLVKVSFMSKWRDQGHGDFLFKKPEVKKFLQVFYL
jgi:hypothetical protein